mmetsp:Transcript_25816/g.38722  ORF Transcript_25816/g.38722 Transcript_25816/m.38722 type:complete len:81 (-) Transcript_25816:153-395(-)
MGIGEKVSRPPPSDVDPVTVAAEYRSEVKNKILSMLANPTPYKEAAVKASTRYRGGGVDQAVAVIGAVQAHAQGMCRSNV